MDAGTRMDAGLVSGSSGQLSNLFTNLFSNLFSDLLPACFPNCSSTGSPAGSPACPNRPVRIVARFLFRTKVAIFSDAARK